MQRSTAPRLGKVRAHNFRDSNSRLADRTESPGAGHALVAALASVIIPLIQSGGKAAAPEERAGERSIEEDKLRPVGGSDREESALTAEARDLLAALERFALSLVRRPLADRREDKGAAADSGNFEDTTVPSLVGMDAQGTLAMRRFLFHQETERQQLLKRIMDEARDWVFNEMPIRLLTFNSDGTEIKLVERQHLLQCISLDVQQNFNAYVHSFGPAHLVPRRTIRHFLANHSYGRYAILSHTWLPGAEVTYSGWNSFTACNASSPGYGAPGYAKLRNFCAVAARKYAMRLGWMDTVCINKDSSTELDESIRSMYKWYQRSDVCIAYLAETQSLHNMEKDKWFTRSWTLQELYAPRIVRFYTAQWTAVAENENVWASDKAGGSSSSMQLLSKICDATGFSQSEITGSPRSLNRVPIWRKMQWAAQRSVTREEDTAYSLMGIFNVSMPTGYGEGADHAFFRLVKEILNSSTSSVLEIANWGLGARDTSVPSVDRIGLPSAANVCPSALIPRSPTSYAWSAKGDVSFYPPSTPITLSHLGLRVSVLLLPSIEQDRRNLLYRRKPKGDYSANVPATSVVIDYPGGSGTWKRGPFRILDSAACSGTGTAKPDVHVFAVLNIADKATAVLLPKTGPCFAMLLRPNKPVDDWDIPEDFSFTRLSTIRPITFDVIRHNDSSYQIPKEELKRHGMTLRTMYL
ncbi:hypothetical protein HYPSUDRAFT_47685 [Hypholoma sublateritium FD-334 SS-4]|uniref:Heterokaryon incompatibility domain-containing protein n=1 Tax=Hypholoma sublateritium (strain FD-334 SS-4) TaxID=945553 RepID=A0A0D2P6Y4_HYPSF|nr:hypothetical protein HYPSUDRAFT_47685 [Hypholoma sublateritium FD-334 SS-4]